MTMMLAPAVCGAIAVGLGTALMNSGRPRGTAIVTGMAIFVIGIGLLTLAAEVSA